MGVVLGRMGKGFWMMGIVLRKVGAVQWRVPGIANEEPSMQCWFCVTVMKLLV